MAGHLSRGFVSIHGKFGSRDRPDRVGAEWLFRFGYRVCRAAGRALRHARTHYKHKNDYRALLLAPDGVLKDVGLTRSDVRDALASPLRFRHLWTD